MSCATGLCGVVDECAAGAAELVVEHDGGGERGESGAEADAEVVQGAGAVAFEGEDVFAGLEDRFDPLADRGEVRAACLSRLCGGGAGSWRRARRARSRSPCRGSSCRRSGSAPVRVGVRSGRASARRRASRRSSGRSAPARGGCRRGRTGRAGGSPRSSGCGWRSSRSRRRRRARQRGSRTRRA